MHIDFVLVDGKKMSKSYGNTVYLRHLLKIYDVNVLRIYLLSRHYHQSIEFKLTDLPKYQKLNDILAGTLFDFRSSDQESGNDSKIVNQFKSYLADDLDTPNALELLMETAKNDNKKNDVTTMVEILGLRY
jgi:cysteinyl-tRNA synthetase